MIEGSPSVFLRALNISEMEPTSPIINGKLIMYNYWFCPCVFNGRQDTSYTIERSPP